MAMWLSTWNAWIVCTSTVTYPVCRSAGRSIGSSRITLASPCPLRRSSSRSGTAFRAAVRAFAEKNNIPVIHFKKGERHIDVMQPYLDRATAPGVVAIGVAQEFQWVVSGYQRPTDTKGAVCYGFDKAERRVSCYYFYLVDAEFGPGFLKICSYFPYPMKVWANGHEWAKRQATKTGLAFSELANGFAGCADPVALQKICDRLGAAEIQAFFDRWTSVIPVPFTAADRAAGYWWELSLRQVEVSRTIVFDVPRHCAGLLRGPGRRQPGHRAPRRAQDHLRPPDPQEHPR